MNLKHVESQITTCSLETVSVVQGKDVRLGGVKKNLAHSCKNKKGKERRDSRAHLRCGKTRKKKGKRMYSGPQERAAPTKHVENASDGDVTALSSLIIKGTCKRRTLKNRKKLSGS